MRSIDVGGTVVVVVGGPTVVVVVDDVVLDVVVDDVLEDEVVDDEVLDDVVLENVVLEDVVVEEFDPSLSWCTNVSVRAVSPGIRLDAEDTYPTTLPSGLMAEWVPGPLAWLPSLATLSRVV